MQKQRLRQSDGRTDGATDRRTSSLSLIVIANGGSSSRHHRYRHYTLSLPPPRMRGSYGVIMVEFIH